MIRELSAAIVEQNPVHAQFLAASLDGMRDDVRRALEAYVAYCVDRGLEIGYLADCYNTIVNDTRAEQLYFLKHGRYRYSTFAEVAEKVYFDDAYMKKYMYGLALTAFMWPNHAKLYDFFERTFPRNKTGAYLEIGPGHGYYLRRAAGLGNFDRLVGIDLSPTSVAMTRDVLEHSEFRPRAQIDIIEGDFLDFAPRAGEYAAVVMGEVLEHVEEPARFLEAIAALCTRESHVFVTTCVNAPAVDHIFLFRKAGEVEDLIRTCGFQIVEGCRVPMAGKTLEECESQALPINVAYVLRKI